MFCYNKTLSTEYVISKLDGDIFFVNSAVVKENPLGQIAVFTNFVAECSSYEEATKIKEKCEALK